MGAASYRVLTPPPSGSAAIAIIELRGDVDAALARLDIRGVPVGGAPLRDLAGVDRGIVARPSCDVVYLMPHAGPAVLRRLIEALGRASVSHDDSAPAYPEATGEIESRMLAVLARAASPLAIDLLLDQPRRWGAAAPGAEDDGATVARSAVLNRLITPPLVVALGRPNIGKSSLLNALAGREVAIVADVPGTTRDHVGASLNFAGLVVRYIDAPGLDTGAAADPILAEAQSLALGAAAGADLILLCADPWTPAPPNPCPNVPVLGLVLRADLAAGALPPGPIAVSARTGEGVAELVRAVRDHLVPPETLSHPGPWRFWEASGAP